MSRADISPYLVHFTSGTTYEDAFTRLRKILSDRSLIAGSRFIKGNYRCVCFSEAPLTSLRDGLVNQDYYSRYSPFGIMISNIGSSRKAAVPLFTSRSKSITHYPTLTDGVMFLRAK